MRFKAVIFDMDGVIFDSEREGFLCWKELSEKYGFAENFDENYRRIIGTNRVFAHGFFRECYGEDFPAEKYEEEKQQMVRERFSGGRMPKKNGAVELLEYLKAEKIKTALASSSYSDVVARLLDESGLLRYFGFVAGGDMISRSKPDPEIFLLAAKQLDVSPCECAVIEDSYNGIRAASAAGMYPIMVPDMLPPTFEMEEKAGVILPDLPAVKKYLQDTR